MQGRARLGRPGQAEQPRAFCCCCRQAHVGACPALLSWLRLLPRISFRTRCAARPGPSIIFRGDGNLSPGPDREPGAALGPQPALPPRRRNRKQLLPPSPPPKAPAWPPSTSGAYPDSGLGEVGPDGDLLPRRHVRVAVPLESGFQLLQLLAGEVSPLPPLPLLLGRILGARVVILAGLAFVFLCKGKGAWNQQPVARAGRGRAGGGGGGAGQCRLGSALAACHGLPARQRHSIPPYRAGKEARRGEAGRAGGRLPS